MEQDLKSFVSKIKNFKSVYLAGGIQSASKPNSWRDIMTEFFKKYNIIVFNPVDDNKEIFNQSILGYKEDGTAITMKDLQDIDELKEATLYRQTEENDRRAIQNSDLIIFYLDERIGHGTKTEFSWVYNMKKPVIIIRTIARKQLSHWTKWKRYFGLMIDRNMIEFKSLTDTQNFLKKRIFKNREKKNETSK